MSKFKKLLLSSCITALLTSTATANIQSTSNALENMTGTHLPLDSETIGDDTVIASLLYDQNDQLEEVETATFRWNYNAPLGTPVTINYAFSDATIGYTESPEIEKREFLDYEKDAIRTALKTISDSVGVTFVEVSDPAQVDFKFDVGIDEGDGASKPPTNDVDRAEVRGIMLSGPFTLAHFNPDREHNYEKINHWDRSYKHDYSVALNTTLHEIGHILGLKHPFGGSHTLPLDYNTKFFSVMAYNYTCGGNPSCTTTSEVFAPTTLKKMDIVALQYLYGKSQQSTNSGNDLYEYDDNYDYHQLLIDSDGEDTISFANATRDSVVDLRANAFSSIVPNPTHNTDENEVPIGRSFNNLTMHVDSAIENAMGGAGNDELIGNALINELSAGAGDDFLKGLEENDTLDGGEGTDTAVYLNNKADYTVEINSDHVLVTANVTNEGIDTLVNIEQIQFADETIVVNSAPVIEIADQEVASGSSVQMVVTATDAEGDTLNFAWLQKSGIAVELEGGTTDKASFTAPRVNEDSVLTFDVMVNDPHTLVTGTVTITIQANNAPVLEDIADQSQDENKSVSLSASATDAENDEINYRWEQTSGTSVTLSNSNTANASFTSPSVTADETLSFTVYASDGMSETSTTANVTVKNVATNTGGGSTNNGSNSDSGGSGGSMGWLVGALSLLVFARRRKI